MKIQNPTITQITELKGDGANLTGSFSGSIDASSFVGDGLGIISGAAQLPSGTVSGSGQIDLDDTIGNLSGSRVIGDIAASSVDYENVNNKPTLISSSAQVNADSITNFDTNVVAGLPSGTVSGSAQTIANLPSGTVSGSAQTIANLPSGTVSGSSQVSLDTDDVSEGSTNKYASTTNVKTALDASLGGAATIGDSSDTITIAGNLTVSGTETTLNTANLTVEDKLISVASGAADNAAANGAGLHVSGSDAEFKYASSGDKWTMNKDLDLGSNNLTTSGNVDGVDVSTLKSDFDTLNGKTLVSGSGQVAIGSTSGTLAVNKGGTGATSAAGARTNLGVDAAGTDNSTDVTLVTTSHDYLSISGQAITLGQVDISDDTNLAVSDTTGQTGINMTLSGDTISGTVSGLQTSSDVRFDSFGVGTNASGTTGEIRATNDITAYYSSDERLKENIVTLDGALDKVKAMRGVTFDWKELSEEERKTIHSHEGHDLGVIAQEVQAQYPELVHERDHGYLSVDYVKLTAVLIEAVKELSAKVDELSK